MLRDVLKKALTPKSIALIFGSTLVITAIKGLGNLFESEYETMTDDELKEKREEVRQAYCKSGDDDEKATRLEKELSRIDIEIRRRDDSEEIDSYNIPHREHGWYLPNDD